MDKLTAKKALTKCTKDLIGDDLIKAHAFIGAGAGFSALVKTIQSANLIKKAWSNIGTVEMEKVFEEVDVTDQSGKLIDILDGDFIGYSLFVRIKTNEAMA